MSFDPITLMTIGAVVGTAGTVVSTISNMRAADYQAQVAARNAQLAEENARRAGEASQKETMDWAESARAEIGALVAAQAASGVRADMGSPLQRRKSLRTLAQRDAERIREEGNVDIDAYRQQSANFKAESALSKMRKKWAGISGVFDTASTYLSGATSINRAKGLIA